MRLRTIQRVLLVVLILFPVGLVGAQSPQTSPVPFNSPMTQPQLPAVVAASDTQAEAVLSQALNAAGGLQVLGTLHDFTASGQITYYWAGKEDQGSVTLRGRGLDQFRLDAILPDGARSWAVSHGMGTLEKPDGTKTPIPGHNAIGIGSLTFPDFYLALASGAPGTTVSTVGTAEVNGVSTTQIRVQRHYASSFDPHGTIAQLTTRDFFIDPTTGLIVKTEAMTHPLKTFTISLPEDVYFSNYQRVNGASVPFIITETINGQKIWTIQLSSIQFNSGLSDADFVL